MITQMQVRKSDLTDIQLTQVAVPDLADGEILLSIDRFALTANNIGYALGGDTLGFWNYYPAPEGWGMVPCWGFADVIASRHSEIAVGERIYGFLPTASHVVMQPGDLQGDAFNDVAAHRLALPEFYNRYQRTSGEDAALTALEDERCLLFPLFGTGFMLYDYLVDNAFFGAEQVLIGSCSSKTGLALANLLARHGEGRPRIIGLTSPGNVAFVKALGTCDEVVAYGDIAAMDGRKLSAFVDMAGDTQVTGAVHQCFAANLKLSSMVGATHWDAPRVKVRVEGAPKHSFLFIPFQLAKRESDWGPGVVTQRAQVQSARIAQEMKGLMTIHHAFGPEATRKALADLVGGRASPAIGQIASLSRSA